MPVTVPVSFVAVLKVGRAHGVVAIEHDPKDIDTAFREAGKQRADGVLVLPNSATTPHRKEVAELALKGRLPAIYYTPEFVEAGGLMSYGVSITDLFRRAAYYVDRILKGA